MTSGEISVTATEDAWRALIASLPKCEQCGQAAEVRVEEAGAYTVRVCAACASTCPAGRVVPLAHGEALSAIECACLRAAGLEA